jgi:hypothetical protein
MKKVFFALVSETFSHTVGFYNGQELSWTSSMFVSDERVIRLLEETNRIMEYPISAAPFEIRAFADTIPLKGFKVYRAELSDAEIGKLRSLAGQPNRSEQLA